MWKLLGVLTSLYRGSEEQLWYFLLASGFLFVADGNTVFKINIISVCCRVVSVCVLTLHLCCKKVFFFAVGTLSVTSGKQLLENPVSIIDFQRQSAPLNLFCDNVILHLKRNPLFYRFLLANCPPALPRPPAHPLPAPTPPPALPKCVKWNVYLILLSCPTVPVRLDSSEDKVLYYHPRRISQESTDLCSLHLSELFRCAKSHFTPDL